MKKPRKVKFVFDQRSERKVFKREDGTITDSAGETYEELDIGGRKVLIPAIGSSTARRSKR